MLRYVLYIVMALSVGAFVALVLVSGFDRIASGVAMVGWGLALLVVLRLLALAIAGTAWAAVVGRACGSPLGVMIGLRLIRESINCLLPVAQVGGDMIGARLLARTGTPAGIAAASILVDLLLQAATQGLFAMVGLAVLWLAYGDTPVVREIGGGLIAAVPALGGFFLAQRLGLFALVDRGLTLAARLWPDRAAPGRLDLQPALRLLYADKRALAIGSALHFAGWWVGIGEIWIVLSRMGAHPTGAECLVLESLGQAVRSAAFAVPGALGVQEGGFILLGSLFGLPAASSVALSLAKRLPELVIGVPGVAVWQYLEQIPRSPRAEAPAGQPST